jgi:FixJ family two-component response regulator
MADRNYNRRLPKGKWGPRRNRGEGSQDVDEAVIVRVLAGDLIPNLTAGERRRLLGIADVGGASARRVAERLGCTARTVQRYRAARRKARE